MASWMPWNHDHERLFLIHTILVNEFPKKDSFGWDIGIRTICAVAVAVADDCPHNECNARRLSTDTLY